MSMEIFIKCVPGPLIKVSGQPNLVMMFLYINFTTTSLVKISTISTLTHILIHSTTIMICFVHVLFPLLGNSPINSMDGILKGRLGFINGKGISSLLVRLLILLHLSHLFIFLILYFFKVSHESPICKIFLDLVFAW
jgi:hypothetical protein